MVAPSASLPSYLQSKDAWEQACQARSPTTELTSTMSYFGKITVSRPGPNGPESVDLKTLATSVWDLYLKEGNSYYKDFFSTPETRITDDEIRATGKRLTQIMEKKCSYLIGVFQNVDLHPKQQLLDISIYAGKFGRLAEGPHRYSNIVKKVVVFVLTALGIIRKEQVLGLEAMNLLVLYGAIVVVSNSYFREISADLRNQIDLQREIFWNQLDNRHLA